MSSLRLIVALHLGAGAALPPGAPALRAQVADSSRAATPVATAPSYGQVVLISPLFAMLGFYTADVERRVAPMATVGASGSAFSLGPFGYRSVTVNARFYPAERALEGFAVGLSAGKIWLSADDDGLFSGRTTGSGVVVGTEATYNWLTGRRHNIAFSVGGGLKRLLRLAGEDVSDARVTYPTVRASLGLAF